MSAEDIRAVSGIDRIIPMLDERPLMVSKATKAVENMWRNDSSRA
jgi:hypothetical protein